MVKGHRIYIEGPDLAGKTTLARNTTYRYCNEVQDRSFISAFVYDQALRGGKLISDAEFEDWCNKFLNNNETWVLIIIPEDIVLEERYHERGDSLSLEDIKKVRTEYRRVYMKFMMDRMNVIMINNPTPAVFSDKYEYLDFFNSEVCDKLMENLTGGEETFSKKIRCDVDSLAINAGRKPVLGYDFRYRFDNSAHLLEVALAFIEENPKRETQHNDYYAIHGLIADKLHYCKDLIGDRRLIAHTDMCISLFHFQIENDKIVVNWVVRSSDVKNKLISDMSFMLGETQYISRYIVESRFLLGINNFPIEFNVRILNAHNVEVKNAK